MVDVDHQRKKFNYIRMRIVIFFTTQLVMNRAVDVNHCSFLGQRRPDFSFLPGRQWTSILLHFSSRPYLTLTKFIELVDCVFFRKVSFLMISLNLSSLWKGLDKYFCKKTGFNFFKCFFMLALLVEYRLGFSLKCLCKWTGRCNIKIISWTLSIVF